MDEAVANAVRRKKKSSLRIGAKLVSEGRGDGFVSAGNTGAAMATAKMVLGTLHGVDRPALADRRREADRKSTRLNSSHLVISYAVFCLKKKNQYNAKNTYDT